MLYSGLFFVELTKSRSNSHRKTSDTFKADTFKADNCYSGHNFLKPREKFKPNLPLYSWHQVFFCGKITINVSRFSNAFI